VFEALQAVSALENAAMVCDAIEEWRGRLCMTEDSKHFWKDKIGRDDKGYLLVE
jgi:hypothetical protein